MKIVEREFLYFILAAALIIFNDLGFGVGKKKEFEFEIFIYEIRFTDRWTCT